MTVNKTKGDSDILLQPCNGSPEQELVFTKDLGNLMLSGTNDCLAAYYMTGPRVVSYGCNGGSNEEFG